MASRAWVVCTMAPSAKPMVTIVVSMAMVLASSHEGKVVARPTGADAA